MPFFRSSSMKCPICHTNLRKIDTIIHWSEHVYPIPRSDGPTLYSWKCACGKESDLHWDDEFGAQASMGVHMLKTHGIHDIRSESIAHEPQFRGSW
jgi:hypothetical protein